MSSFTSACSSIDFGFSQCFGGWQNASVEVKLSAGQSFPATATGMDVTESVSDLASKTFILTGATGTLGRACAKILRARGCKLIFASRDVEKASAFVGEMEKEDFEGEDEGMMMRMRMMKKKRTKRKRRTRRSQRRRRRRRR